MISTQWIIGILLVGVAIGELEARYLGFIAGTVKKIIASIKWR